MSDIAAGAVRPKLYKVNIMKHEVSNFRPDLQMHRIDDAAAISRLSRSGLYNHMVAGRLKSVKIGGRRLIPETALREFLQIGVSAE